MQRIETPHNTPDQVREYLAEAEAIAIEFGINREAEPVLFCKLLDLVSTKQITVVQQPVVPVLGGLPPGMNH